MVAAVTITPASGSITAEKSACEIAATGMTANDTTAYDSTKYPSSPAVTYYFKAAATGQTTLKSPVFTPASGGTAIWPGSIIFPAAATWTLTVNKVSDDSAVATASVVVG
jgi:hypothetical protein